MNLLNNTGNLVKVLAIYIVVTTYTGALIVAGFYVAQGRDVPTAIMAVLSSALGLALPALGLVHGVTLVNSDTAAAIKSLAAKAGEKIPPANSGGS